jgi:hypothetical protein
LKFWYIEGLLWLLATHSGTKVTITPLTNGSKWKIATMPHRKDTNDIKPGKKRTWVLLHFPCARFYCLNTFGIHTWKIKTAQLRVEGINASMSLVLSLKCTRRQITSGEKRWWLVFYGQTNFQTKFSKANKIRHSNNQTEMICMCSISLTNKEVGNTCHVVKCQAMCMLHWGCCSMHCLSFQTVVWVCGGVSSFYEIVFESEI